MANTISAAWAIKCAVTETIDLDSGAATFASTSADPTFTQEISGLSGTLTASTTVPATKACNITNTLPASGSQPQAIDLASLTGYSGVSVDMTDLEPQMIVIKNNSTTNSITVVDGASNGYPILGDSSGSVTIPAGGAVGFYTANGIGTDIDATHSTIDVTGTEAETYSVLVVAG